MDLVPGQFVGDHELLSEAGAGGFSVVWKARNPETGALVAIKFPRVEALVDHLRREVGVAQHVTDPRIVPILETHLDADPPHLVMPWIEGHRIATPTVTPPPADMLSWLTVVRDLAAVLARLHAAGVAHGDVKPGNVLVDAQGACHLLDFGLARLQVATRLERSLAQSLVSVDGRSIAGTLDYMAPEIFDGKQPGIPADVYSLGVLLHGVLTGRPPAFGVSPSALNPYLPPGTEALLRRMLHHDPAGRAKDAGDVLHDLDGLIAAERRCLARKNGHERRRVFMTRMATVRRGLRALLSGVGALTFVVGSFYLAAIVLSGKTPRAAEALTILGVLFGSLFATFVPLLLAMTTINAFLMRVPEKTYKNRTGHPIWSFMMQ